MFSRILVTFAFLFGLSILTTHAQQQPTLMLPVGHTGAVNAAAFSPDGKRIVTASDDKTAKLWDGKNGTLLTSLDGHAGRVNSVGFCSTGKKIFTTSADGTAKIWDSENGRLLVSLNGHLGEVYFATFSPNGNIIVTISADNTAKMWKGENGTLVATLKGSKVGFNFAGFSFDGKTIFTKSRDGKINFWDGENGLPQQNMNRHSEWSRIITFSPDAKKIVTVADDSTAKLWDVENGLLLITFQGHNGLINTASLSRDGKKIVTASTDKTAKIWDVATGALLANLEENTFNSPISSAIFSPDGKRLVTISVDKIAFLWNCETGILLGDLNGTQSVMFSPNGSKVITISEWGEAKLWSASKGIVLRSLNEHTQPVKSVNFSPDGKKLITTGDKSAKIWDSERGTLLMSLERPTSWVVSAAISPDEKKIATGSRDNTARIWDYKRGILLASLRGHNGPVLSTSFSPDGTKILTTSTDGTAKLWDTENGALLGKLEGHEAAVFSADFSPNGKQIITASSMTTKIWDGENGMLLVSMTGGYLDRLDTASIRGHTGNVNSAKFSRDGKKVVTASSDGTAKLWDSTKGSLLTTLEGHEGAVFSADFSPDGKAVVTASDDNTIKLWDSEKGSILHSHAQRSVLTASFSPDGKSIVTASRDRTAKIWDSEKGTLLISLEGHNNFVSSAAFVPDGSKIITTSGDNTTKIWDKRTGKLKYTLLAIDSTDYLVYDEHYRYDGTENARKLLYFTCGTEVIELDQVKDQLWVPNLAERIMKGEEINSPKLSDLDLCDLIPTVEELEHGKEGAYQFRITPRRGGLGQTVVFVNGIEVKRLEVKQLVPSGNDYLLVLPISEVEPLFKPGQPNQVSVRAFTKKNDIGSRGATVETVSEKKSDPPALHAVVVGVSDYKGDALDLKYAAKDARDFSNALNTAAGKLFNFDGTNRIHLYPIHTEADRKFFPDKKSIQSVFESIGKQAQPNDVLLIFFAGHGVMNPADQQFYFLTADASAMANPEGAGISTKELFEWIQPSRIKAQKRVLILDACNSGQAINDIVKLGDANQGYTGARSDEQGKFIKAIDKLNERSGLFILSAAASDQSAYEMGRYNQGVLTYALLKSAKEDPSVLEGSQFLNLGQWFDVAQRLVEDIAASSGARQQPQVVRTTNFNIGVVDEEVRKKIILPQEKPTFTFSNFQNNDEDIAADNLGLNNLLDQELSNVSSRSAASPITFMPGTKSTDAWQLSGRYTVADKKITVRASLRQNNEVKQRFELTGESGKLEELAKVLLSNVLTWISQK